MKAILTRIVALGERLTPDHHAIAGAAMLILVAALLLRSLVILAAGLGYLFMCIQLDAGGAFPARESLAVKALAALIGFASLGAIAAALVLRIAALF